jgi:hypothetical protein
VRQSYVAQKVRDPDRRQSFTCVVRDDDLVNANGFSERNCGAGARDPSLRDAFGVRRVDINADRVSTGSGVDRGSDTTQRFSQHDVCSTVQYPYDLTITLNRHARYRALGGDLEEFDPHLPRQFATARRKAFLQFRVQVVEYSHSAILPSAALGRLKP